MIGSSFWDRIPENSKLARPSDTSVRVVARREVPYLRFWSRVSHDFPTPLANPEVVETIRRMVQTEKAQRGEVPKDLPKEVLEEIKRFGAVE